MTEQQTTAEQRAALRELRQGATGGVWTSDGTAIPWTSKQSNPFVDMGASISTDAPHRKHPGESFVVVGGAQDEQGGAVGVLLNADADLIAAAVNAIPFLLADADALAAALAEIKRLRTALEAYADPHSYELTILGLSDTSIMGDRGKRARAALTPAAAS